MKSDYVEMPCQRCGRSVRILSLTTQYGVICESCIARENAESNAANHAKVLKANWESICPKAYQDTQIDKLPFVAQSQRAMCWPNKDTPWIGLNLWGAHRTGKTRTILLVLKHRHFLGDKVRFLGPSEFAQECEKRDWKTAHWINALTKIDIVCFDDIDKCQMTKVQEEKFFALLDARMRNRKPLFFTGNSNGGKLELQFRNGKAIIERIREFCTSIHFPAQQDLL